MDGLSGAVIKPYKGAKEGGWAGFSKGLAKGVAGLVTGPGAGIDLSYNLHSKYLRLELMVFRHVWALCIPISRNVQVDQHFLAFTHATEGYARAANLRLIYGPAARIRYTR